MYKIENKSVSLATIKTKNRLLDNYLDWIIYSILPKTIGDVLFPKFAAYGWDYVPMECAYIRFNTPQTITDSSTTMVYDKKTEPYRKTGDLPSQARITEVVGTKTKLITINYDLTNFFIGYDDNTFEGLGFGREDDSDITTPKIEDFLLSYVDLGVTETVQYIDNDYGLIRVDEISTNETSIVGGYGYLPGEYGSVLQSISMCYSANGADMGKEYLCENLTFALASTGNVSVTGFDDFFIESGVIYPKTTLYPKATVYPSQAGAKILSVKFRYKGNNPGSTLYETYINIEDLGVAYNNKDVSINLICERG